MKVMGKFLLFITRDRIAGISLWPFGIYVKKVYMNNPRIKNHELTHWAQQKELPVIFYLWYFVEWILRGYDNISFEQEANDYECKDLGLRKHYNWLNYLK